MRVFLCEKPSQAKDIAPHAGARARGEGCITGDGVAVTWCIGHLLEQAKPEHYVPELKSWALELLPVMPENWQLEVKDSVKTQYRVVRQLLHKATEVVIATDADREGEVIAREVLALVGYRGSVQRLWLSAFDPASIKKGLAKMKSEAETRNLYFSGLGRSRADWLMGMNITMALTTAFGAGGRGGVLHCGRVQTPVLGLIVRRERAISVFKPKTHFVLDAKFEIMGTVVPMDWVPAAGSLDVQGHCVDQVLVQSVAAKVSRNVGRVSSVQSTPERELAPLPYYLGSLQKEASRRFGIKVQAVLDACQALYEKHKATTYPRTDCEHLPLSMHADVPNVLQALVQSDPSLKQLVTMTNVSAPGRCFNDSKITAHHAIIPTANPSVRMADMSRIEQIVYELIRRRYIAQFLGDHLFTKTVLAVACEGENFVKTGKVTTSPGWKRAELADTTDKAKSKAVGDDALSLPACRVGDQANNLSAACATKKTEPPKRYTEGTLVAAMESIDKEIDDPRFKQVMKAKEKAGIGTDATRPAVIEGLFKRDYIVTDKKFIVPSDKGKQLIELLEKIAPQLVDPVLTAHWEERLMQVEAGKAQLVQFEGEIRSWLGAIITNIKAKAGTERIASSAVPSKSSTGSTKTAQAGPKCPVCGKGTLRAIKGSNGPFWGCSEYRDGCRATFADQQGKPVLGQSSKSVDSVHKTAVPKTKVGTDLANSTCPNCGNGRMNLRKMTDTKREFWGCSAFPACRHFVWAQ